jgi:prepilin peptidase CpaA
MSKLPLILLCCLMAMAVWSDLRTRRIPNRLVFGGALLGLLLNTLYPAGAGLLVGEPFGGIGLPWALAGLAMGLGLLLPMYMLRALGAGDVKMMAMVGAFVGPGPVGACVLLTFLAGGVLAVAVALATGKLRATLHNTWHMSTHTMLRSMHGDIGPIDAPAAPSGRLPYAVAIAAGTLSYLTHAAITGNPLLS